MAVLVVGVSLFASGCHRERPRFSMSASAVAPPLSMQVLDADQRGRRLRVRAWLMNRGDQAVLIDRDAMGLRLANGRVLPISRGRHKRPYLVRPGQGRMLKVDFRLEGDVGDVRLAALTLGGSSEPSPKAADVTSCTTVPAGAVIVIGGEPGVIPKPRFPGSPASAHDASEEDDDDDDPPSVDARPSSKRAPLGESLQSRETPAPLPREAPGEPETWEIGGTE